MTSGGRKLSASFGVESSFRLDDTAAMRGDGYATNQKERFCFKACSSYSMGDGKAFPMNSRSEELLETFQRISGGGQRPLGGNVPCISVTAYIYPLAD